MMEFKIGLKKACVTFARSLADEGVMSLVELRPLPAAEARDLLQKSGMKKLQIDKVIAAYNAPPAPLPAAAALSPVSATAAPAPAKVCVASCFPRCRIPFATPTLHFNTRSSDSFTFIQLHIQA
jgi:hypothetical protein